MIDATDNRNMCKPPVKGKGMGTANSALLVFDTRLKEERDYWVKKLSRTVETTNLTLDYERPEIFSEDKDTIEVRLPRLIYQKVAKLAGHSPFLIYTTLLTALKICLHKYTGSDTITVGSPVLRAESPSDFVTNALAIADPVDEHASFRQLLLNVRGTLLESYARPRYPIDRLIKDLGLKDAGNRCPLFDIALALENIHAAMPKVGNDITISFLIQGDELSGRIEFNGRLFRKEKIERFKNHFINVLSEALTNLEKKAYEFEMLTDAERHQLLIAWNDTRIDYARESCIHQLFELQVERTPEAIAVTSETTHLTYRELNRRANRLAYRLQSLGVGPERRVGICMERSLEMVIAIIGILKAGASYIPLHPTYPKERLAFILRDAHIGIVLGQEWAPATFREQGVQVIGLDSDGETLARGKAENPVCKTTGENLVYMLYTSGSTGEPKGVLVEHRGLCNLSEAQMRLFAVGPSSFVLQFASLSFDASIFEIVMALRAGATLCLVRQDSDLSGPELIRLLHNQAITHVTLPPSVLAALPDENLPALRTIIVAGEACPAEVVARWATGRHFFNAYGPTETTVWATVAQCIADHQTPPIGQAIPNTQVYLLNAHFRPVPVGVPAELYVGGVGLARGYLNRPELTAERFLPNPFSTQAGARLYKTGDLARHLSHGPIEFLGRRDHQVKLRGFRIELGEIEAMLRQHPALQEAVVLAREDLPGDKRLVAYVVPNAKQPPENMELRRFLRERLPEFMVPSTFVMCDTLPRTPSGKVNRRALPAPERDRPGRKESLVAPRTPVEKVLAGIWARALGLEEIGIHDNFFELGGDSILSIQILARANQAGLQLTSKQLFQYPTLAELSQVVGTTAKIEAEQGLVTGSLPLTPVQRWFFEQDLSEPHHFNQSVLLEARQALKAPVLESAVRQLMLQHDALRLRFSKGDSGWEAVHSGTETAAPFSVLNLSELPEGTQTSALEAAAVQLQASLDLTRGPLVRMALVDLGTERPNRLLWIIHHLIVDGVSWRILLEDLQTAYQQRMQGQAIQLPPKTTSFQHWAQRVTAHTGSGAFKADLVHWLTGPPIENERLPVDDRQGANTEASAQGVSVSLTAEDTQALLQIVPGVYHTQINEVLLTALVQAFHRRTGQLALWVSLEGHGREELFAQVDLSRTVGWFTALFPVRLQLSAATSPGEALKSIKEQLRRIPQRGFSYGALRHLSEEAAVVEPLRAQLSPQISFNYLGQFDQILSTSSLFSLARESSGPSRSPSGLRSHLLDITGLIGGGRLQMTWIYSAHRHRRTTIEGLAQEFIKALRELIIHCKSPSAGGYTPSDFPLVTFNQQQLDKLIKRISKKEEGRLL